MADKRCIGCRWRTPKKFGGYGIICLRKDGTCPGWAIQWALRYSVNNGYGRKPKSFPTDESLLERLRL